MKIAASLERPRTCAPTPSPISRSPTRSRQTGVSRHHARIVISEGEATLEDLGSKNGTYLRGKRIASAPLADGDEIRMGKATLTFRLASPLSPTETVVMETGK